MPVSPPLFAWPSTLGVDAPFDPTSQPPLWSGLGLGSYSEFETFVEGVRGANFSNAAGIIDGGGNGTGAWTYDDAPVLGFGPKTGLLATTASGAWNRIITMASGPVRSACFAATLSISSPPSGGDATFANVKDLSGTGPNTVRAGLRCTTTGFLRIDDGTVSQYTSSTPITGGDAFTYIWYVQTSGQQVWIYDKYGNLVEYSGVLSYTSNIIDSLNFGSISAWGIPVVVMRWGNVGYSGVQIPAPTPTSPPPAVGPWPFLPTPGSPLGEPFLPFNPWWFPDQAAAAQSAFSQTLTVIQNPVELRQAAVAATRPVLETPALARLVAVAARLGPVVENPARSLRAAVAFTLVVVAPPGGNSLSAASSDFEDGTTGAWTTTGVSPPSIANSTTQAHTGTHSMVVTLATISGSSFLQSGTAIAFSCTAGITRTVIAWVYVPSGVSQIRGNINGTAAFTNLSDGNDRWVELVVTFLPTASSHTLTLYAVNSTTAGQQYYVDTVSATPTTVTRLASAVAATLAVVEAPTRLLRADVAARLAIVETVARSQVSTVTKFLSVAVTETTVPKLKAAVAATLGVAEAPTKLVKTQAVAAVRPVVEGPLRTLAAAITATLTRTEQPAASVRAAIVPSALRATVTDTAKLLAAAAATRPVTETTVRTLKAAVAATLTRTEPLTARVSPAVGVVSRVVETGVPLLRAAVAHVLRRVEAPVVTAVNATVSALSVHVNATVTPRLAAAVSATRAIVETTIPKALRAVAQTITYQAMVAWNLLPPATYNATSTAGIAATNGSYVVGSPGLEGATAFYGTATGAGDGLRLFAPTNAGTLLAGPGETWYASATIKNTSASSQAVTLFVQFFDSGVVFIVASIVGTVTIPAGATVTISGPAATISPAATARAQLLIRATSSPNGYTQTVDQLVMTRPQQGLRAAIAATRPVVEAPARNLVSAVVPSILRATSTTTAKLRTTVGLTFRASVSALPRPLRTAIAAVLRFVERPVAFIRIRPPNPQDVGYELRLDEALWTADANGLTWTLGTRGGGMYAQNATSDQPIPVKVQNRFGDDPTSDETAFVIVDTTAPVPQPGDVNLPIQGWFTDDQGNHFAMCLVGPTGNYIPTPGTVKHLYLKLNDTTLLVLGPVTVTFR